MLLPCDGFYLMRKLWFSKVKRVNLIRNLPGTGGVLWPLGEGFAFSGSLSISYVYTGWLMFVIQPCDGTVNKGCPWSPWFFHNCSSCGMWRIAGLPWQFLSNQQMLFYQYSAAPLGMFPDSLPNILHAHRDSQLENDSPNISFAIVAVLWLAVNDVTTLCTFLSEGKDLSVRCVSTLCEVIGETLCVDLQPCCNHLLWAHDVATQWNTHQLCALCYLQLLDVSVYLGCFLLEYVFKFNIWALLCLPKHKAKY